MSNLISRKLGKYELTERLGRGGAAEVYKAFQPGIERFVAVKVLHSHLIDLADFVARFQREARAIGTQLARIEVSKPVNKPQKRAWLSLVLAIGCVAVVASVTSVLLIAL